MKVWRELRKGRKVEEKQQQNLEMPKRWVRGEHQRCSQSQEGGWGCGIHETLMFVRVSGLFWVSLSFFSNVQWRLSQQRYSFFFFQDFQGRFFRTSKEGLEFCKGVDKLWNRGIIVQGGRSPVYKTEPGGAWIHWWPSSPQTLLEHLPCDEHYSRIWRQCLENWQVLWELTI